MIEVIIPQVTDPKQQAFEFDKAVKKFKKLCNNDGFLQEVKDRKYYTKPSQKKRLKDIQRQRELERQ